MKSIMSVTLFDTKGDKLTPSQMFDLTGICEDIMDAKQVETEMPLVTSMLSPDKKVLVIELDDRVNTRDTKYEKALQIIKVKKSLYQVSVIEHKTVGSVTTDEVILLAMARGNISMERLYKYFFNIELEQLISDGHISTIVGDSTVFQAMGHLEEAGRVTETLCIMELDDVGAAWYASVIGKEVADDKNGKTASTGL